MPIVSQVGGRSLKVRLMYASIFLVLIVGAVTMVYPFLLMLAGSVKSEADAVRITPYPEFWFDDLVLFQKYAESKYNVSLDTCKACWSQPVANWRRIAKPDPVPEARLDDFAAWRNARSARDPGEIGHVGGALLLPINARLYRKRMFDHYRGDSQAFCRESRQMVATWSGVFPPVEIVGRYRNLSLPPWVVEDFQAFKRTRPVADCILRCTEGDFIWAYLVPKYTPDIGAYNKAHDTAYRSYEQVPLSPQAPANPRQRLDWEEYVRNRAPLDIVRLDPRLAPAWRAFLAGQRYGTIERYNATYGTHYAGFADVPFTSALDECPGARVDWENFLKDRTACPPDAIRVQGPTEEFLAFLNAKYGAVPADTPTLGRLVATMDYRDCMAARAALRWEFTTRNYRQVMDYIALHGNGLRNTLIYCLLAVVTALFVNPLAAYALSRFKLPGTYKILLFCMATMAFPGEVTMIPGFILLKRFPLWPLVTGTVVTILAFLVLEKAAARLAEKWRSLLSMAVGIGVGALAVPAIRGEHTTASLLNTYAALVLPGMANGFFIFLLKGFFDSLPKELYEAAEIDGAGEWTKFWLLTMNLSKPVLAVIALGAFTGAYSAFMMALIIIPDQRMWTIMVWIYQLQSQSHQAVVYASLVIAALPTFVVFVVCQNVIMRGIVVPTEK